MNFHSTSNWLGEPCRVRLEDDPDEQYARLLEDLEAENALVARQLKLFPRAEVAAERGCRVSEFSVCQFFADGSYEYVRRFVSAEEAIQAFRHYISSVGARIGTTVRVIITDGGDCANMEWEFSKGVVFPQIEGAA